MLRDRKAYEAILDQQMADWGVGLEAFKLKAKGVGVDGMIKYDQTLEALQRKHEEAGTHLANLKDAGEETWEQVKVGTDKAWGEFKALFKHASE
jgi:hypothetical protein